MFQSSIQLRVRYAETDQMGYVYYGNYAQYFEVARVEALRQLGMSYKEMEESGVMLPVIDFQIKYIKPAYYDDLLTVVTTIPVLPQARIVFQYEIYNEQQTLLNKAETTLVFINKTSNRPCQAPAGFIDKLKSFFVS